MRREMIFYFVLFAAASAELSVTPCIEATEESACHLSFDSTCDPPVKRNWSSTTRDYPPGYDVFMFCEINTGNGTLTRSTWSVRPHRSFQKNVCLQRQVLHDGNTIRASLTLRNVTEDDEGLYTITLCNMCGSVSCQSKLTVLQPCSFMRPDPVLKEVTINASLNVSTLKLAANFSGTTDQTQWWVIWSNSSASNLGNFDSKYYTRHRKVSDCFFTEELIIHNVSMKDAGLYFAKVYGTDVNTTFYVNIMNHGDLMRKKSSRLAACGFSFVLSIVVILPVIGSVSMYLKVRRKRKHRKRKQRCDPLIGPKEEEAQEDVDFAGHTTNPQPAVGSEEEEVDLAGHTTNPQPAAGSEEEDVDLAGHTTNPQPAAGSEREKVFLLYCKTNMSEESLVDMTDILAYYGISSCLDITTKTIPANWSIWTEGKIESCHYVILVCTGPLYRALKENINDTDNPLVEMFKGKFNACAIVNHVQSPKFIPVFIDRTPDVNVVPSQLRTHHFYHLRIKELMQAREGKPDEYVDREIKNNPLFIDIKKLITDLL